MNPPQNPEHDHHNINCAVYHSDGKCPGYPHAAQNPEHKQPCEKLSCTGLNCVSDVEIQWLEDNPPQRVDWRERLSMFWMQEYGKQTPYPPLEEFIATVEADARRAVIEEVLSLIPTECPPDYPLYEHFRKYTPLGAYEVALRDIRALLNNLKKDV